MRRMLFNLMAVTLVLVAMNVMASFDSAEAGPRPEPSNKVVFVIDGSGSYKRRQAEAMDKAIALLDQMANVKLYRWDSGSDRITIISLDAMPDVIWEGSLRELKTMKQGEWTERFMARKDLSACTDVSGAFRLAIRYLDGDPRYVSKYLFIFSDLIHEPPTSSVRTCANALGSPSGDMPWEGLRDISIAVFWVPPDQKLLWKRAVTAHTLDSTFKLYSDSESSEVKIAPPPKPEVKNTEEERAQQRNVYAGYGKSIVKWGTSVIGGGFLALIALGLVARYWRRRTTARGVTVRFGYGRPLPLSRPGGNGGTAARSFRPPRPPFQTSRNR